jgi:hypothetical protein
MTKSTTSRPRHLAVVRPASGKPGSGHVFVVEHKDGDYRAACLCLWKAGWRRTYEQVRADWDGHVAEAGASS